MLLKFAFEQIICMFTERTYCRGQQFNRSMRMWVADVLQCIRGYFDSSLLAGAWQSAYYVLNRILSYCSSNWTHICTSSALASTQPCHDQKRVHI